MNIPVKACDILVTGNVLALQTLDAMFTKFCILAVLSPLPLARTGTDEHFNVVALHHSSLLLEYLFCCQAKV